MLGVHEEADIPNRPSTWPFMAGPIPLTQWQKGLAAYICGLFAAGNPWLPVLIFALCLLAFVRARELLAMSLCLGLGVAVGIGSESHPELPDWEQDVRVQGRVDEVRPSPGRRVTIVASAVRNVESGETLPRRLLWTLEGSECTPEAGQQFEANLRIRKLHSRFNFGLPSSEERWKRLGVGYRTFSRGAADIRWSAVQPSLRSSLMSRVSTLAPAGAGGAVIRALLFGDRYLLDTTFMDRIRRAGLSHSLALSGLHLSLVAGFGHGAAWVAGALAPALLLRVPRQKLGNLLALPMILAYLWLGGGSPSLMRAALMLFVLLLHQAVGTRPQAQDSLFLAVGALVMTDPVSVHDLSLQLSVLAVAGIICFLPTCAARLAPLGQKSLPWNVLHAWLMLGLASLCANLFILPLLVHNFGEVTPHLWLNLLWLPMLSLAVLPLSFLGLTGLPLSERLASWCFMLAGSLVEILDRGLTFLDLHGGLQATAVLRPQGLQVAGYWTVLVAGGVLLTRGRPWRKGMTFLCLGLGLLVLPALGQVLDGLRAGVEMTVLDTGMSQAVFVRTASGRTVLVDGGGAWSTEYDPGRALVGPALAWNHAPEVDGAILSHVDADHARGLFYILEAFDLGWFGWSGLADHSADSRRLQQKLASAAWPARVLRTGDRVTVEPDLWFDVLYPGARSSGISGNETSLVLRLVWRGVGLALLPGDAEQQAIESVLRGGQDLDCSVLVLPHHGSRSSLHPGLYRRVGASWAVAACGPGNRFGFPHPEVVRECVASGATVMTTAEHGAIRFVWREPQEMRIETARTRMH